MGPGGGEALDASPPPARPTRGIRSGAAVPLLVIVVAATLRLVALGHIDRLHFDESYYANDAHDLVERGVEEVRPAHPPLGKWLIAGGIAVMGFDPVGWRVSAALAGTVTVGLTYAAGMVLFRERSLAAAAGLLVAFDGLAITSSRMAMLDVFLGAFVACLLLVLLLYLRDVAPRPASLTWWPDSWQLWAAGVLAGGAVATKWSAAPVLLAVVGIVVVVETRRRRPTAAWPMAAAGAVAAGVLPTLGVAAAVYLASYSGFLVNYTDSSVHHRRCAAEECPAPPSERLAGLVFHHRDLIRMHRSLEHEHPYRSDAASWPLQRRPVLVYLERCPGDDGVPCVVPDGTTARIVMVGNPVVWWSALLAAPVMAWGVIRQRRAAPALVLVLAGALYLPWFLAESGYLYYLVPLVPFAALAVVAATSGAGASRWRSAPWAIVGAAIAMFLFLLPIWYGVPLGPDATDVRLLLSSWR